ncbi:MAG: signal peptidase II [Bacilli bacterium]|nr:signal peptidase II [Bacilli bacterium]
MIPVIIISIILLIIDQISKILVIKYIDINNSIELIKNFFYLTYTHNEGAAFSILTGQRIFLILIAITILIIIFNYIRKNKTKNKVETVAFSLIIGGSLGNLIDRIVRGYVVDFLDFKILGYNYPIFNLADTFIVVGVFLLFIFVFRKEKNHDNRH